MRTYIFQIQNKTSEVRGLLLPLLIPHFLICFSSSLSQIQQSKLNHPWAHKKFSPFYTKNVFIKPLLQIRESLPLTQFWKLSVWFSQNIGWKKDDTYKKKIANDKFQGSWQLINKTRFCGTPCKRQNSCNSFGSESKFRMQLETNNTTLVYVSFGFSDRNLNMTDSESPSN